MEVTGDQYIGYKIVAVNKMHKSIKVNKAHKSISPRFGSTFVVSAHWPLKDKYDAPPRAALRTLLKPIPFFAHLLLCLILSFPCLSFSPVVYVLILFLFFLKDMRFKIKIRL